MSDTTPAAAPFRYDEVPYESHAYAQSHIDRMATLARLFGLSPVDPRRTRVLEIGCAAGGNLIPMAMAYPESEFLGIDLSQVEIDEGNLLLAPMGLGNIELRHADATELDASWGTFDYILCHGVWTWVPEHVQEHIFEACRRCLSPQGVAYISYNVHPGWRMRQMVRDMMLYHTASQPTPQAKVEQARALLDYLVEAHGPESDHPYARYIRSEADLARQLPDHYLYHDHMSDQNEPVYFHEFVERAAGHALAYLGDAHFGSMLAMHMPEPARAFLSSISDLVKAEQYMDFVRHRMFRTSYLVHAGAPITRKLGWQSMVDFHYALSGELDLGGAPLSDPTVKATLVRGAESMSSEDPLMKAAMQVLVERWPRTLPFDELLAESRRRIESANDPQTDREDLGGLLLSCFASNMVEVWSAPAPVGVRSERPEVFAWTRLQLARGAEKLTNLRHQSVQLDPLLRRVMWLADGTRDRDALITAIGEHVRKGRVEVRGADGEVVTDDASLDATLASAVDEALARAEEHSLLTVREVD